MFTTTSSRVFALFLFTHVALATLPLVDFNRMGTVGLTGSFLGIELFQNSSYPAFDPTTATLFSRDVDGALTPLASTNAGGQILAGCSLKDTFYIAGEFTSIGTTSAINVASSTSLSEPWASLGSNGPNGPVNAIFCDVKGDKIWVGGSFSSPGSNVAVWDPNTGAWSKPPFVGVSGAQGKVLSITANASDSSIFFSGSFITTFPGSDTISNNTNNPNVPVSQGATPFSSSLVPVPLENAQVVGSPSTSDPQFSSIQSILCPSGADGPGNSWFAADSSAALVTIRAFSFISANGIRLGNTFQNGHGTTAFSVTTIPDNIIQTLQYRDPNTGQTLTCSDPCPLSTDASLLYQDFLFDSSLSITGVQIKLSAFTGTSAGLHMLQILSSGAFASSVDSNNGLSCFAPNPSNTTHTGEWEAKVANTDIAGTTQTVLVANIDVGTSAANGPTFTWMPYVSASGNYDINLLVPGCTNFQDCSLRTSVKVTVFTGQGLQPRVTTVSQQNENDATVLLYSGPVVPSSPDFVATITMAIADDPAGEGQGGKYELVADRVQLVLRSVANATLNDSGNTSGSSQGSNNGFGFLEWPRTLSATADATHTLPNSTLTSLDMIGIAMFEGAGGDNGLSFARPSAIAAVIHTPSGEIYLGGNFSLSSGSASGSANLVAFKNGALTSLAEDGLNGPVTSMLLNGDQLFVGGGFTDTLSGSMGGQLRGIALYNIQSGAWSPLGAGLDGLVTSLSLVDGKLLVAGNFSQLLAPSSSYGSGPVSSFAAWDLINGVWVNSGGFVIGSLTFVGNDTSSTQIVAGNVVAARKVGASGMVIIQNGDSQTGPTISPLGTQLDVLPKSLTSATLRRRSPISSSAWMYDFLRSKLFSRQTASLQLAPLPESIPALAPAVLAGVFWTNTSSSEEIAIIGGNFSYSVTKSSVQAQAIALYNPTSATVQSLTGSQLNGTVRTLLVDGNTLYIGGEFSIPNTSVNGLAIYNLEKQTWDVSLPPLQGASGSPVIVRSISKPLSKENTIIVAGAFSQAGALNCRSICAYDTSSKQWNTLGSGIQGEVSSVAYAGQVDQESLIASGSTALSDNTPANVVQFSFANNTWTALGDSGELPGPVTAVEVNNGNASSVFAAGRYSDGSSSFLSFWNGVNWFNLVSTLQATTTVSQLTMVPLQDKHSTNGVIEPDRMLMVSGLLFDSTFGNASSALFDGQTLIPYISTSSANGSVGAVASLFRSFATFSFNQRHFLAVGVVILISIAIAAGVVFLIALIGIVWTLVSRRDDKLAKFDADEEDDDSAHHRPSSLLEHINAATRTTILGAGPFMASGQGEKATQEDHDPFGPDASNYMRAETPSDAVGGMLAEETSRPAHARYSFDGAGEGELPISAGAALEVLDDRDAAWWYARNVRTGQEGVVPAAYLY